MTGWPFGTLVRGGYSVILADPPWAFETRGAGNVVPQRAPVQHYPTMTFDDLAALPVAHLGRHEGSALCMWSTSSNTEQALALARRWGFTFKSKLLSWAKLNAGAEAQTAKEARPIADDRNWKLGMGFATRRNTEDCWLFTRGKPLTVQDRGVRELIVAPIREHSRKPDEQYDRIERLFGDVPRCELFSRTRRPGWTPWGNDTGRFNGTPT